MPKRIESVFDLSDDEILTGFLHNAFKFSDNKKANDAMGRIVEVVATRIESVDRMAAERKEKWVVLRKELDDEIVSLSKKIEDYLANIKTLQQENSAIPYLENKIIELKEEKKVSDEYSASTFLMNLELTAERAFLRKYSQFYPLEHEVETLYEEQKMDALEELAKMCTLEKLEEVVKEMSLLTVIHSKLDALHLKYCSDFAYEFSSAKGFYLAYIEVDKKHRGKGHFREIINTLIKECNRYNVRFSLRPGGASHSTIYRRLVETYNTFEGLFQAVDNEGFLYFTNKFEESCQKETQAVTTT